MRVIVEGKESIVKLWGSPAQQDTEYRLMRYLVREDCEDGTLLLNTVTGELVLLTPEEVGVLDALPTPYTPRIDPFIARHFLVPNAFDEAKAVNQLRKVLRTLTSGKEITGYSILPTSACNAQCFYCYESNYPKCTMSSEIAIKVADYIADHCGEKKRVTIQWFGGEPTLGEERIDLICNRLHEKGISYVSSSISNGYLFSKEMTKKAKEKWKLLSIQITLDGTEDIYNTTKAYVNAVGSPYQKVLDNIGYLLGEGIHVKVRMNLDFHNIDDLKALIDELSSRFAGREGFVAYVRELNEDLGYSPVHHNDEERHKLVEIRIKLNRYIEQRGLKSGDDFVPHGCLPSLRIVYCMADSRNSLLVNPLGQFGKCDHFSFNRFVGDVENGHDFNLQEAVNWLNPEYIESCEDCCLFPSCGQPKTCEGKVECLVEHIEEKKKRLREKMCEELLKVEEIGG